MYKLIATDLDGTLLNDNKEISKLDIDSIHKIIDLGYVFSFSTGRPLLTAKPFFESIKRDIPLILYNGAFITTSLSNKVIHSEPLGYDLFFEICNKYNSTISPIVWADEVLYSTRIDKYTDYYTDKLNFKPIVINPVDLKNKNVMKMILLGDHSDLEIIKEEASKLYPLADFYFSEPHLLEVVRNGVSKNKGVRILSESLGIDINDVIGVGDEENDLPMLLNVGLPIAVSNANKKVKEVSKYITKASNNESPMTEIINKFILNK